MERCVSHRYTSGYQEDDPTTIQGPRAILTWFEIDADVVPGER